MNATSYIGMHTWTLAKAAEEAKQYVPSTVHQGFMCIGQKLCLDHQGQDIHPIPSAMTVGGRQTCSSLLHNQYISLN